MDQGPGMEDHLADHCAQRRCRGVAGQNPRRGHRRRQRGKLAPTALPDEDIVGAGNGADLCWLRCCQSRVCLRRLHFLQGLLVDVERERHARAQEQLQHELNHLHSEANAHGHLCTADPVRIHLEENLHRAQAPEGEGCNRVRQPRALDAATRVAGRPTFRDGHGQRVRTAEEHRAIQAEQVDNRVNCLVPKARDVIFAVLHGHEVHQNVQQLLKRLPVSVHEVPLRG
mmetsp:Transcript_269/g.916  ORF Transcript_269/g.916 Transcript_269/m.916 type:complete len:228 (+) Transcript_269:431-1114(+)